MDLLAIMLRAMLKILSMVVLTIPRPRTSLTLMYLVHWVVARLVPDLLALATKPLVQDLLVLVTAALVQDLLALATAPLAQDLLVLATTILAQDLLVPATITRAPLERSLA